MGCVSKYAKFSKYVLFRKNIETFFCFTFGLGKLAQVTSCSITHTSKNFLNYAGETYSFYTGPNSANILERDKVLRSL